MEIASRGEGGLETYLKIMGKKPPIGHDGQPEDVAYAILFLASDEARFVTGAALVVDGGYTAVWSCLLVQKVPRVCTGRTVDKPIDCCVPPHNNLLQARRL